MQFRGVILFATVALLLSSRPIAANEQTGFRSLFDGESLDGWVQHGGKAKYTVEGGTIVGRSVPKTPNSFLCTKRRFRDFVLEYEFRCDTSLNSGVQIRSNVYDKEVCGVAKPFVAPILTPPIPSARRPTIDWQGRHLIGAKLWRRDSTPPIRTALPLSADRARRLPQRPSRCRERLSALSPMPHRLRAR